MQNKIVAIVGGVLTLVIGLVLGDVIVSQSAEPAGGGGDVWATFPTRLMPGAGGNVRTRSLLHKRCLRKYRYHVYPSWLGHSCRGPLGNSEWMQ